MDEIQTTKIARSNPSRRIPAVPILVLAGILVLAASIRLFDINWDSNQHLHPDERHIVMVTMDRISLPFPKLADAHLGDPKLSTLNPRSADPANGQPRSFAYGTLPLLLLKLGGHIISPLWREAGGIDGLTLIGRALSALFDLGTVLVVFLIGRWLYGLVAGLLASLLVSLTVLNIQLSHFYASDTLLAFFVFLTLYLALRVLARPSAGRIALMGVATGLALSCKVSAAPLLLPCAVACFLGARPGRRLSLGRQMAGDEAEEAAGHASSGSTGLLSPVAGTILAGVMALGVFLLIQPYVLMDPQPFIRDIQYEGDMVRGVQIPPYTIQYIGTEPILYQLRNLLQWAAGPALGVAAIIGLLLFAFRLGWNRRAGEWVIAAWVIPYLAMTLGFQVKFIRYLLPVAPLLVIMAAAWLAPLTRSAARLRSKWSWAALVILLCVLLGTAFQAAAFTSIYGSEHTRVQASRWIYDNTPRGAALATEHWDDSLPLNLRDVPARSSDYTNVTMPMYDQENEGKRQEVIRRLMQADYIILASNRLYASIPRVPQSYPMASAYYSLLLQGKLGFDLAASFSSYPSLGPWQFVDDAADESFTVYDHPKVLIFKKGPEFSQERLYQLLGGVPLDRVAPIKQTSSPAGGSGLLLADPVRAVQQQGGTWSALYNPESIANQYPVFAWWLALQLLGLLALPIVWRVFSQYPDRGYGLSKIVGLLAVAYGAWLLASLRLLPFGGLAILLAVVAVALGSAAVLIGNYRQIALYLVTQWRRLLVHELLFLAAFALFLLIRARNPDLWHLSFGGEKPMEFAFLNAVARSTYFPPYDPWFAGGFINYYYFGYVLVATLIRLTGIVPAVAFNLAIPAVFALTAAGLFSFGFNYLLRERRALAGAIDRVALLGGMGCVTLVLLVGNLDGLGQTLEALWKQGGLQARSTIPMMEGVLKGLAGLWAVAFGGKVMPQFDFWRSTRIIGPESPTPITEFPYFTFLYGDLHPHMIAMPLATLALGLTLAVVWQGIRARDGETGGRGDGETGRREDGECEGIHRGAGECGTWASSQLANMPSGTFTPLTEGAEVADSHLPVGDGQGEGLIVGGKRSIAAPSSQQSAISSEVSAFGTQDSGPRTQSPSPLTDRLLTVILGGLVVGALQVTNSWDYPTYLLLLSAGYLLAAFGRDGGFTLRGILLALLSAAGTYVVGTVLFLPFSSSYELFYNGVDPAPAKTSLPHYLLIFGLFLFAVGSWLLRELSLSRRHRMWLDQMWSRMVRSPRAERRRRLLARLVRPSAITEALPLVLSGLAGLALLAFLLKMYLITMLLLAAALVLLAMLVKSASPQRLLLLLFVGMGLALTLGVEFVTIKGDIGRMNTVFKFYLQAWFLFGIVSALGVTGIIARWSSSRGVRPSGWRVAWAGVLAFLVLSVVIYPVQATPVKVGMRFQASPPTLDGMAYMNGASFKDQNHDIVLSRDLEAIRWLQGRVSGSPTVLEAQVPEYRWGSRISIYTGLPTILGWTWHERQQRWGYQSMIDERVKDIKTMYESTDPALVTQLLAKYQVRLIYVGDLERAYYPEGGLAKFGAMVGRQLSVVYERDGVTIYEVKNGDRPSVVLAADQGRDVANGG